MPQRSAPRSAPGPALAEGIYSLLILTKFKLSLWCSMLFPTIATWVDLLFSKTLNFCPSNKRSRKGVAKGWLLAWNIECPSFPALSKKVRVLATEIQEILCEYDAYD